MFGSLMTYQTEGMFCGPEINRTKSITVQPADTREEAGSGQVEGLKLSLGFQTPMKAHFRVALGLQRKNCKTGYFCCIQQMEEHHGEECYM